MPARWIEPPLPDGFDGPLIESTAKRAAYFDAADAAIASNDDLENHVALDPLAPGVVGVERPNFPHQSWRINSGAWLIHTSAGAAAAPGAEAATAAFADALP